MFIVGINYLLIGTPMSESIDDDRNYGLQEYSIRSELKSQSQVSTYCFTIL